jgi:nitrate reductase gamma subunit
MGRHLAIHLGGALAAVAAACLVPMLAGPVLGHGWALLALVFALAVPALLIGFVAKVLRWVRAPVPFRIPLTVGQQRSLRSIAPDPTRTPHTAAQAVMRALLDILLFRPLLRSTPTARALSPGLDHGATRSLWLAAAMLHGSLLVILIRHLRLFLEPVPSFVAWLESADSLSEMTLPKLHASSVVFFLALLVLLGRRLWLARMRYLSLAADYFPLLLLLAIATTGLVMRHIVRTDVSAVKSLAVGVAQGSWVPPTNAGAFLFVHLFLLGVLLVYFPLSKLMHMPGVWLSPTLTLANSNRECRHVNPNNPTVEVLHYADYEAAFRGPMIEAGLPVEKE